MADADAEGEGGDEVPTETFRPGKHEIGEDEVLEYDSTAYEMYHPLSLHWPCLSFDIYRDDLGFERKSFPKTAYVVTGTQAAQGEANELLLVKMDNLHRTLNDDDESVSSDEDDRDDEPVLKYAQVRHAGCVNRVRAMPQDSSIVATWSESKGVTIWNMKQVYETLATGGKWKGGPEKLITYRYEGHDDEGYGLDWSPRRAGVLASGDNMGDLCVHQRADDGTWTSFKFSRGHNRSIEDVQWSPTEDTVLITSSADRSIRVWDTRKTQGPGLTVADAHGDDINVITWNRLETHLLASGCDDGSFRVWDLRMFKRDTPVAEFRYHRGPITSIEWHPTDSSTLAVASADNTITLWDLGIEKDTDSSSPETADIPDQLLFEHAGQVDIKEVHWHPQLPHTIISTASDGFNIFTPANLVGEE
eukprot:TRINITY_DN19436_c0_g1::TRINITY_DN19436_c0_g1_i1::g.17083::m.17083 TRINITY_DN19436_c0_g1::TRINITY_DN19436_c0_g1_i1::g.17083  ORF type:complete len:476 (-),score=99.32,sp/Q54ED4/GRWD1_DICDI/45.82/8e-121,WD40/PF00400.27/2.1e+02,WD40/PF00400.27/13,WD40/PF00400.27/8.7e-09,WD40/PF00400.27/3.5e-05,WD40/PF00400.27/4.6e-09,WD40/PF00400.27/1.9e+02,CAF1C_H4-bd/PF12265.3/2.6e-17,eIF2A/PF08662.6/4.6e-05,Nucleoporin_N/PF08801.6/0.93,Nucleoporin_N/PF08801.6/3.4,Nup160/PF11715.3/0.5 TRINITY_DN19436_c0_g1_i1:19-